MKYKEIILDKVFNTNNNEFTTWLAAQPLLEQVEILKELKQLSLSEMFKSQDFSIAETLKKLTKKTEEYHKNILAELEAEKKYNAALKEQEAAMLNMEETATQMKQYVINCILNNEPNAPQMKELAQKIITLEKEQGIYNPNFWKEII